MTASDETCDTATRSVRCPVCRDLFAPEHDREKMTDLRQLIAMTLRGHNWYFVGNLGVPGMNDRKGYKCACGWETRDDNGKELKDPFTHVAEAITDELLDLAGTGRLLASIDQIARPQEHNRTPTHYLDTHDGQPRCDGSGQWGLPT
jgi:hypothetical protein